MGELASAVDALAADDLQAMFGPQLLERLGGLLRLQNRIAAEVVRSVREHRDPPRPTTAAVTVCLAGSADR